jgi:hypothetical protein
MVSSKSRVKRVSEAASQAFEAKLRSIGINTNDTGKQLFSDGLPTLADFIKRWKEELGTREDALTLLGEIDQLIVEHPIAGEDVNPTLSAAAYIKDVQAFKRSLSSSVDPGAMAQWGDLPTPKF